MFVFVGNWYRRDLCLASCEWLPFDSVNIDSKYFGSSFRLYQWYNFNAFVFMISSILSRSSVFSNGSVWALYLLHVIIRTALFCSLNILSDLSYCIISTYIFGKYNSSSCSYNHHYNLTPNDKWVNRTLHWQFVDWSTMMDKMICWSSYNLWRDEPGDFRIIITRIFHRGRN